MPGLVTEQGAAAKAPKPTKNQLKRARKKQLKTEETTATPATATPEFTEANGDVEASPTPPESDAKHQVQPGAPSTAKPILDVPSVDDILQDDPLFEQYKAIFGHFEEDKEDPALKEPEKPEIYFDDNDNIQDEEEEEETRKKLSKKARKQAQKLSIAELKAIVRKPEIVEWTDIDASDPKLLVAIKASRNVVPVPKHWSVKREYLSSKRGVEKPGFKLPKFIAETGIAEMRDAVIAKEDQKSLKQKQRERVQPKTGKLDIDYQKLYEAFFKRQTKPTLTRYGEVYYEGKEDETKVRQLRPGELTDELKEALNMPPGAPPPWLINEQRHGPPPAYPALKIPGLNAPPPPGASWGFHPGGYGKPPVDENGRPLFGGEIYGVQVEKPQAPQGDPVEKAPWAELPKIGEEEDPEAEDEDEDENEDDEGREEDVGAGLETPFGTETPGGITSNVPTDFGTHTSSDFELRKIRRGTETDEPHPRQAGQVIGEKNIRAEGFFGGDRAYDLSSTNGKRKAPPTDMPMLDAPQDQSSAKKRRTGDVDVSVDVDALEGDRLSKEELQRRYEAQRSQEGAGGWKGASVDQEDLSNMIAEESAKRQQRDRARRDRR